MAATLSSLPIPAWQKAQLQQLSNQGQLNNVNPLYIGLISGAESTWGNPGNYNSSGFGGYFGTTQAESGVANPTNPSTYGQQAMAASAVYAAGLRASNGNPIAAENYYQTGSIGSSSHGASLFAQYLGGGTVATPAQPTSAQASGSSPSGFSPSGTASLGPINLQPIVDAGLSGALVIGAVVLVLAAALLFTKGSGTQTLKLDSSSSNNQNGSTQQQAPPAPPPDAPPSGSNVIPVDFGGVAA